MTTIKPLTPAEQHTKCWKALTAVHIALDQYQPGAGSKLDAHIAKIRRWLEQCEEDIRSKKPSAGAIRDMYEIVG